ncbi:kinesin-like protein KIN-7I isoform X2 [Drosophila grimshawi]|uniref:kinesin-like protein KIN-7I isoform X2 n=1 Tax=Drosophila grimshawi TaxID=7222 RepID=UPI000C870377|nr:kinesin-like protein KIN-7I isoform X2 [Drosophila grimshawi]
MSAKSAIQVCIKLRPCEPGNTTLWQVKDKRTIQLIDSQADPCVFDYVFDQDSNNQMVFDCMAKHIVEACIKGFNGTIFAYGQTSSGKTYTMMGDERNPGVMVLAAKEIFNQIALYDDREFLIRVGYIEIYNEKIYDLLNKKNQDLKIHESNGMVHVNCEECIITSEHDLLQFLCMGNKERTVGETNMNERSSRSHAIFRIIIESRKTDHNADDAVIQSLLNLVDLAGSERADQTGARGARLKEGGHINKSLHFLSNVIKSLAENEDNKYVNFRDSKLTRILQASLGGNTFTSIICSIKPSIMEESQSTLNFAMRAKKIRLKPQINELVSDATMMKRLEREIKELKDRLAKEQERNESQIKVRVLEQRIKNDTLKIITGTTIADKRNKNRRRTWCPATSHPEAATGEDLAGSDGSNADQPKHSGLPKPSFYPSGSHIRHRALNAPKTINIMKSLEIEETDEEFNPAVEFDFGPVPSPMVTQRILPPLSLTPRVGEIEGCEDFDSLTESKLAGDTKIEAYEEQLQTLKQTVQRLEMENRLAVDLEFQFENHKSKSKRREEELLAAISEKDGAIGGLQHKLDELSRDVLRNSKEDHMLSICPEIETNCESICNKCANLERLLEEHKQTTANVEGTQSIDCECEQLRVEIAKTRAQLETVQLAYKQVTSDVAEKSQLCDRLGQDFVAAEEAKELLQDKCNILEETQQQHNQILQSMQAKYEAMQEKYVKLQEDYERLESMQEKYVQLQQDYELRESSQEKYAKLQQDYAQLESQNESLQEEIRTLKTSMQQIQEELMQTATATASTAEINDALVQQLRSRNEELIENLAIMETKFEEIQREYDDLSNQLMESVQDGDSLRAQCNALQEQLKQQQQMSAANATAAGAEAAEKKTEQLLAHIAQLESEVAEKNMLIDATEGTINEMREQMTNLESALLEKSVIVNKVEDYQRQIESLEKQHAEMTMVCEELQEKVKENTLNESESQLMSSSGQTLFNSDSSGTATETELDLLTAKLSDLKTESYQLQLLLSTKDELIERIQSELQELNERCMNMDVLQVELQANARQNQQLLERQSAKLADDADRIDKLQETNAQLLERSIKAEETVDALKQRLELAAQVACSADEYEKHLHEMQIASETSQKEFELREQQNKEKLESSREEYEKRLNEMQAALEMSQKEFELKWQENDKKIKCSKVDYEKRLSDMKTALEANQKQHKDALDNAKLEYLQKIEASESRFRTNLRKSNIEWEQDKARYEASLERLQKQLSQSEEQLEKLSADSCTKLLDIKAANELAVDQLVKEKHELESMYDESQKLVQKLQSELSSKCLEEKQDQDEKLQELLDKYEKQMHDYEQLKAEYTLSLDNLKLEKSSLQFAVDESKSIIERLNNELQAEHNDQQQLTSRLEQLESELVANAAEKAIFLEKVETLSTKIAGLVEEVKQAELKAIDFDKLHSEHEETICLLNAANDLSKNLAQKVKNLDKELMLTHIEVKTHSAKVDQLQSELEATLLMQSTASSEQSSLTNKLKELKATLFEQSNQFEHKLKEVQSSKNELQLQLDSLLTNKLELETANQQLTVKLKNVLNMQSDLDKERESNAKLQRCTVQLQSKIDSNEKILQQLKLENAQLEERLTSVTTEASKKSSELGNRIEILQKEINKLRTLLKTNRSNFDAERLRLDGTISSLLDDKRNLEEKICTTEEILKKLESDLRAKANGSNLSFDSNSSSTSSAPRKSLDRETNHPRKSISSESELRKNRRISTHDEWRRQSYWNDSRHVACMTDPVDKNCNCEELDSKLKDCQRQLFIAESIVTTQNMELKNHPLKEETATLKKRLQEEQAKARDEIKRLRQKNLDLMSKVNVQAASAAISASSSQVATTTAQAGKQLSTAETQTESDVETALQKITDKLNESLRLCRIRYHKIKDLEDKLKQNENADASISLQTTGQINVLKSQLEVQKKDFAALNNKYEYAKRALKLRGDELDKLRKVADADLAAPSK